LISLVYTVYNNPKSLTFVLTSLSGYSKGVRDHLEVVIVDDCSRDSLRSICDDFTSALNIQLFRVARDRPWNHRVARNIGAWEASSEWLLLLDIDMLPTERLLAEVTNFARRDHFYMFRTKDAVTSKSLGAHHDSLFISSNLFWRIGGYDEAFKGFWGTGPLFLKRAKKIAPRLIFDHLDILHLAAISELDSQSSLRRKQNLVRRAYIWILRATYAAGLRKLRTLTEKYTREI
jgi:glycosyltransferase involved in cell wall biosynthesis